MNKYSRIFTIISVNLLVTFILLEGVLRLFPELIPPTLLLGFNSEIRDTVAQKQGRLRLSDTLFIKRDDGGSPHRLIRFKPFASHGQNTMDSMGFCNIPGNLYDAQEHFDVVTVGDSFTYCWKIRTEETWPSRLSVFTELSVYNLAIHSVGPYEYVQLLKNFGIQKNPTIVVMHIYGGNDLRDSLYHFDYLFERAANSNHESKQAQLTTPHHAPVLREFSSKLRQSWPARNSYAFNTAVAAVRVGYKQFTSEGRGHSNFRYRVVIKGQEIELNTANVDSEEPDYARMLREGRVSLEAFTEALQSFMKLSRDHGFTPVISYMPPANIVYKDSVVFEEPGLAPLMQWFHDEQVEYFGNMGRELGFEFIDLTASMVSAARMAPENTLLNIPNDLHPTAYSQRVVADTIARHLKHHGLIPRTARYTSRGR